jgi:hypothetical protein
MIIAGPGLVRRGGALRGMDALALGMVEHGMAGLGGAVRG